MIYTPVLACCLTTAMIYYVVASAIYAKKPEFRRFILMVIVPLPIALFVGFTLYLYGEELGNLSDMIAIMIGTSVTVGIIVLLHCYIDRQERNDTYYFRVFGALILIGNPFLLYAPDLHWFMVLLYLISGILLGIYGYLEYYRGKKIGLIYVYFSIIFMVIVPVIALSIALLYLKYMEDEIIYRHAHSGWVSCHLPATPMFVDQREVQVPTLFASGYLGFMGVMSALRKAKLESEMKQEGVIPPEFDKIVNSKSGKNE